MSSTNIIRSRKILYSGCGQLSPFINGTKVTFHFKTEKITETNEVVIDDSKTCAKPMELIIGKQFKLVLWEEWLKHMRVGEVSQLIADKSLCQTYPFVSKCYRQYCQKDAHNHDEETHSRHCCGSGLNQGLGHKDLDELIENPCDLKFTIELVKVEPPNEYEKEVWQMSDEEKMNAVTRYREEGNQYYAKKMYTEATERYSQALGIIEQLLLMEKPGDDEWIKLDQMKVPLLSNYSQCKLIEGDYYAVIEHTSEVIKRDENNVKALFRRAKAHFAVWNLNDAKCDFNKACLLDSRLENAVKKELHLIELSERQKNKKDMALLKGKLFT